MTEDRKSVDAISVTDLSKTFAGEWSLFSGRGYEIRAVRDITLALRYGETLAVVGESGSGKSTLARMMVGLETPTSGDMRITGKDAAALRAEGPRAFGRVIQYVFQDPVSSLNPRKTVDAILDPPLRLLKGYDRVRRRARMKELMDAVQMPANALERYPHEFSGGQAQRIAIARALAAEPRIIVLDEPVSALDVSVQAQILLLLEDLRKEFDMSYLFISHDLAVVESISDRVAVMYSGEIVEIAPAEQLFRSPRHEYTRKLLSSAPRLKTAWTPRSTGGRIAAHE
ncbi:ABC transporter ATP-binding protein [Phyllobacterium phragmitis]|uniref:ABC transporter ATP-binding protein n=1 Tax=Phyllobacterium phragmitis TaxID=2670329 RepID=A0A2S9IQZ2_9HYPH|nr:ATP-binding cassette domain-containing protein [Phyllobacterium phragmitis]PRD42940.1 ABC transporter ATP-binding protein [Phyllobacterium phragmitis]